MMPVRFSRLDFTVGAISLLLVTAIGLTVTLGTDTPGLRIAYLKTDPYGDENIWLANPDNPEGTQQVTQLAGKIASFDVSPDGRYIVYATRDPQYHLSDLHLLDLTTGRTRVLTTCYRADSDCTAPQFRPDDGQVIAYQRRNLNTGISSGGIDIDVGNQRIWLVDLSTDPAVTYPLFQETQILGYSPTWSPDGTRIAFYDTVNLGILIYDFYADSTSSGNLLMFRSNHGTVGTISPDGTQMVFPEVIMDGAVARGFLRVARLQDGTYADLTDLSAQDSRTDDQTAIWHPTDGTLTVGRRFLDERFTPGQQIYRVDPATGESQPIMDERRFGHGFFSWDPAGKQLAMQRVQHLDDNGQPSNVWLPEVWVYNAETEGMTKIDEYARSPIWVPGQ